MKYIFLLLLVFSLQAEAAKNKIPTTAQLIYSNITNIGNDRKSQAVRSCQLQIAKEDRALEANLEHKNFDVSYHCKTVYKTNSVKKSSDVSSEFMSYSIKPFTIDHYRILTYTAYCEPRTLREKQIISLSKSCEENPTDACYTDTFLQTIDSIKPTEFIEIKESC